MQIYRTHFSIRCDWEQRTHLESSSLVSTCRSHGPAVVFRNTHPIIVRKPTFRLFKTLLILSGEIFFSMAQNSTQEAAKCQSFIHDLQPLFGPINPLECNSSLQRFGDIHKHPKTEVWVINDVMNIREVHEYSRLLPISSATCSDMLSNESCKTQTMIGKCVNIWSLCFLLGLIGPNMRAYLLRTHWLLESPRNLGRCSKI